MHRAQEVYEKLRKGDSLTDQDVSYGRSFFRELERRLIACGPIFRLAWLEAMKTAQTFDDIFQARHKKG